MGASFGNVQVRVPAGSDAIGVVRAVLDALALAEGMVPTEGDADRQVIVVPSGEWISLFDERADGGGTTDAHVRLSAALGPALSVLVHDSDVLQLELAVGGKIIDSYDSNPAFSGKKAKRKPAEHLVCWVAALGLSEEQLRGVFVSTALFAEAPLAPLADALGIPRPLLSQGYRYLLEQPLPDGASRWGWRFAERPSWERRLEGPPRLLTPVEDLLEQGHSLSEQRPPGIEAAVGAELRVPFTTSNRGGASRGLRVEISAPPWLEVGSVELILGDPRARQFAIVQPVRIDGGWVAAFPDAELPAGAPHPDAAAFDTLGIERAMALRHAGQVHVNLVCRASLASEGEVRLTLIPEGPSARAATGSFSIAGRDTSHRPLRAAPTVHPAQLAPLTKPARLAALVVGGDLARLVAIPQALDGLLPEDKVRSTSFLRPSGTMPRAPKLKTVKARGFFAKDWPALAARVPDEVSDLRAEWVASAEDMGSRASIELGLGVIPSPQAVPALAIAFGPDGDIDAAQRALIDAIDATEGLIQALVTRWDTTASIEWTPYEQVCGVMGQCTLERSWVERWLRGLGAGVVWLGPALRAHVPGAPARLEVSDVRAAEQLLAPILPGQADWLAGSAARYRQSR